MSKKHFERRLDDLENEAEKKLLREVLSMFARYGWNAEKVIEQGSLYELEILNKWARPKIEKIIKVVWPVIVNPMVMVFIENFVWPFMLHINPEDDERSLQLHFDQLYSQNLNPQLWREFIDEIMKAPNVGEPDWDTWSIPKEMVERFKVVNSKIEERKEAIRKRVWEECKEEVQLLREEGSIEAAEELEKELRKVGAIASLEGELGK